jgi:hypothetical protein
MPNTQPAPQTLTDALTYAARGWRIIPLYGVVEGHCTCQAGADCPSAGKHPPVKDWTTAATTTPARLRQWWQETPGANVGIVTGQASHLVVIDVDPRHQGDLNLEELQQTYQPLPETVMVLTGGGGQHYYFTCEEALPSCDLAHGIQFQTEGRLVVAPPSLHGSGRLYAWEISHDPDEMQPAPLPAWVRALALAHSYDQTAASSLPEILPSHPLHTLKVSARIKYLIHTGSDPENPGRYPSRSEAVFAVLQALIHGGHDDPTIAAVLLNPAYRISDKPRSQRDPRSPAYEHNIRAWVSKEIARARAKYQPSPNGHPSPRQTPMMTPGEHADTAALDLIDATRFPFVSFRPKIPALPTRAQQEVPTWETWLHAYAKHSAYWAPRAAPAYHTAVGLWVLSTIAARRIVVHMGSTAVYPTLFIALVSESTHWTKSTAASIGIRLLRRAGCGHLLSPDRTTPQFLLKLMSGIVPQDYGRKTEEEQEQIRKAFAFSAQRGWFYEEWGGMLHQMRRVDSPQAELNKLLIVLEGGEHTFETGTIQRGLERIVSPYLALLGNATPHDLAPFMGEGDAWWHDGFWPRFVCVTPPHGAQPVRSPRPREAYHLPSDLILPLHAWHERLGSPDVTIEEVILDNGKRTGEWAGTTAPQREHILTLAPEVYDAYETYNDALLDVVHNGDVHGDLSPWYGRAHEKALRVAMLLASVHGQSCITLPYWQEAQHLVESWRITLHELVEGIGTAGAPSRQEARRLKLARKIETLVAMSGGMTARELQRHLFNTSGEELSHALEAMVKIGTLTKHVAGRKTLYLIFQDEADDA